MFKAMDLHTQSPHNKTKYKIRVFLSDREIKINFESGQKPPEPVETSELAMLSKDNTLWYK